MFISIFSKELDATKIDVLTTDHLVTFSESSNKANRVKSLSAGLKEISQNTRGKLAETV